MEVVTDADFRADEFQDMKSLSRFDILVMIAEKAYEKEFLCVDESFKLNKPLISMPMSEKKPLRFDLNLKPRTHRRPRSNPIDVQALFPSLHAKRKQEDMSETSCSRKRVKVDVGIEAPDKPDLPTVFRQKISEIGGSDPKFMIKKLLYRADVLTNKSRLTMPYKQCKVDFGDVGERQVRVVHMSDEGLSEMWMSFKKWDTVSSYVFNGSWNSLVQVNRLQKGDVVQVWSFSVGDELAFALVKL